MKMTPLIQKAINKACQLHNGQFRKAELNLPYISHPFSVAWLVAAAGGTEQAVVAALLHDILEDVAAYNFEQLAFDFGADIAAIVREVSEDEKISGTSREPWRQRKERYLVQMKTASEAALQVAAADKIHNLQSMMSAYKERGEEMWKLFHAPQGQKLWFYGEVLKILQERLDSPLVTDLARVYQEAQRELGG